MYQNKHADRFLDASGFLSFQHRTSGHSSKLFAAGHPEMHCSSQIYPNPIPH